MNIQKKFAAAFIAILLGSTALYAADAPVAEQPIQMTSGGVGEKGMDDITAVQQHYSLKLVFAKTNGEYQADVGVQISDHKGNTVVNTTAKGPVLLVNLAPGVYTVSASLEGETKTKRVVAHEDGLMTYFIRLNGK